MLLAALMAIFVVAGNAIGGKSGMIFAIPRWRHEYCRLFFSDKIALLTSAKPLPETQARRFIISSASLHSVRASQTQSLSGSDRSAQCLRHR